MSPLWLQDLDMLELFAGEAVLTKQCSISSQKKLQVPLVYIKPYKLA